MGVGQPGRLALEFSREADSAEEAVRTALADVKSAVPSARLIEASPDLVGLADVADLVGKFTPGDARCHVWSWNCGRFFPCKFAQQFELGALKLSAHGWF